MIHKPHVIQDLRIFSLLMCFVVVAAYAQGEGSGISGTLLMLDEETPHAAVPVQLLQGERVVATTLSDSRGDYRFVGLAAGSYQLRCQVLGGYVYYDSQTPVDSEPPSNSKALDIRGSEIYQDIDLCFAPFKKGDWRTYDKLDGLSDNAVITIAQTPDGVMWFGMEYGGFCFFDGHLITALEVSRVEAANSIFDIHVDAQGLLWLATRDGVATYDGNSISYLASENGLADDHVQTIYQTRDGMLWFGTKGGVSRYDGQAFVNFTTQDGLAHQQVWDIHEDPQGMLWFGTSGGLSRYDGKQFTNFTGGDGLTHDLVRAIHGDSHGVLWLGTAGGVSRYDGERFTSLTSQDGLLNNYVLSIQQDSDGVLWFGTWRGLSRYDGQTFVNFTAQDGLSSHVVNAIYRDTTGLLWLGTGSSSAGVVGGVSRYDAKSLIKFTTSDGLPTNDVTDIVDSNDGTLWLGTWGKGVSHYDGQTFVNFTTQDGLVDNYIMEGYRGIDGRLWFGTKGGVSHYDGHSFSNLTTEDGLLDNRVSAVHQDINGSLWFGTWNGVSRYDGRRFTHLTMKDGLVSSMVCCIHHDTDSIWFGTFGAWEAADGGVSHYDGSSFTNFTWEHGLASNTVLDIHRAVDGTLWFATGRGVSQYDGNQFTNFVRNDGLPDNNVWTIYQDTNGLLWFGTFGGGAACYDGSAWASLDPRDGLTGRRVGDIHQDTEGCLWFATEGGVTRYQPNLVPPRISILSVTTPKKTYDHLSEMPLLLSGTRVTVDYQSIDFKTHPPKQQYRCRIREVDGNWRVPTKSNTFDHTFSKPGTYTFEVQAIDRDLNYSEPASVVLTVVAPFYQRAAFLVPTVGGGSLLFILSIVLSVVSIRRRRQVHAYERQAVQELQDARQMQLSLLPKAAPTVAGFEFAGVCQPANGVAGDHYTYLWLDEEQTQLLLVLMDVTGHGMQAASAAFVAHGILVSECAHSQRPEDILQRMHARLQQLLPPRSFVAASFILLDVEQQRITHYNAGLPRPILIRDGEWSALPTRGGLPLGCRLQTEHVGHTVSLESGDVLLLFSDGLPEAEDSQGQMYRELRLELVLGQLSHETHSAEEWVDAFIGDVQSHILSGELRNRNMADFIPSQDDVTLMVLTVTQQSG